MNGGRFCARHHAGWLVPPAGPSAGWFPPLAPRLAGPLTGSPHWCCLSVRVAQSLPILASRLCVRVRVRVRLRVCVCVCRRSCAYVMNISTCVSDGSVCDLGVVGSPAPSMDVDLDLVTVVRAKMSTSRKGGSLCGTVGGEIERAMEVVFSEDEDDADADVEAKFALSGGGEKKKKKKNVLSMRNVLDLVGQYEFLAEMYNAHDSSLKDLKYEIARAASAVVPGAVSPGFVARAAKDAEQAVSAPKYATLKPGWTIRGLSAFNYFQVLVQATKLVLPGGQEDGVQPAQQQPDERAHILQAFGGNMLHALVYRVLSVKADKERAAAEEEALWQALDNSVESVFPASEARTAALTKAYDAVWADIDAHGQEEDQGGVGARPYEDSVLPRLPGELGAMVSQHAALKARLATLQASSRGAVNPASKEAPEASKEAPDEASKEAPDEASKEAPDEASKEAPEASEAATPVDLLDLIVAHCNALKKKVGALGASEADASSGTAGSTTCSSPSLGKKRSSPADDDDDAAEGHPTSISIKKQRTA